MQLELHTERLHLSPFVADDVDLAIAMFTDPAVRRFTGGAMSEDAIRSEMPNWIRRGGNGCIGVWSIAERDSGDKIGSAALLPIPVDEKNTDYSLVIPDQMPTSDVEIGYHLIRSAWGNGFATEACKRLLQFAFEDSPLVEVVATFDTGNVASRQVLVKAGFIDRGTRRCYGEDGLDYRITRDEWLELQQTT